MIKMNHEGGCEFQDIYSAFNEKIHRYLARLVKGVARDAAVSPE